MDTFSMVLHGPPKTWKRTAGNGKKRYNLTVYRNWKKDVQWVALQNKVKSWGKDGVRLTIRVNLINRQHMGDVDNYAKGIQDALEGFLYDNDKQVYRLLVERTSRAQVYSTEVYAEREPDDTKW